MGKWVSYVHPSPRHSIYGVQYQGLATLPVGKELLVPAKYESGWVPELIWTISRKEMFVPCRIRNP